MSAANDEMKTTMTSTGSTSSVVAPPSVQQPWSMEANVVSLERTQELKGIIDTLSPQVIASAMTGILSQQQQQQASAEALRQEHLLSMLTRQQPLQELSYLPASPHAHQQTAATTGAFMTMGAGCNGGVGAASVLHQEQQQQLAWLAQQQQQQQQRAQLLVAQSLALAASGAVGAPLTAAIPSSVSSSSSFTLAGRQQRMWVEQEQLIRALEHEAALVAGDYDDGSTSLNTSSRRPNEICFLDALSSRRSSVASNDVAAAASAARHIQDALAAMFVPAGLNRQRVVSESSLSTIHKAQVAAAAAVETKQATSSSQGPAPIAMLTTQKPKRPLSAYNLFFKEERARMMADDQNISADDDSAAVAEQGSGRKRKKESEENNKMKRKKIGFAILAQSIGAAWKSMDEASLQKYKDLAGQEKQRYQTELVVYKACQELEWQKNQKQLEATVDKETRQRYFATNR